MIYVATQKNLWELVPSEKKKMRQVVMDLYTNDRTAFERMENEVISVFHTRPDEDEVSDYIVNNFTYLCYVADSKVIPDEYYSFFLDESNVRKLVGKTVVWYAPAYEANGHYGGMATIKGIDKSSSRPLIVENEYGDDLGQAFVGDMGFDGDGTPSPYAPKPFCYSDGDRFVSIHEVD